jgi:perosamine synthetase
VRKNHIKIPVYMPEITDLDTNEVTKAVSSGWVSSKGPFIEEFEKNFSAYIGTRHGVSTSNGTTALHLALVALGIGPGDEVIVPSFTFIAVANAVHYTGATPVLVDSNRDYWCIEPTILEVSISKKTRAIIAAHMYGHPCDMDKILRVAKQHDLAVIEDCAEAHGAEYNGRKVGNFGTISCFSFYGNKIITTGEGGMCLTNDEEIAERLRILRDHGMDPKKRYWHNVIGFNYRMTNLQAALGVSQLKRIDSLIRKKRSLARSYELLLSNEANITLAPEMKWAKNVFWMYSVLVRGGREKRDRLIRKLESSGIESRPFFYPIHILPPYKNGQSLPVAEQLSSSGINLPSGPQLTEAEVKEVASAVRLLC